MLMLMLVTCGGEREGGRTRGRVTTSRRSESGRRSMEIELSRVDRVASCTRRKRNQEEEEGASRFIHSSSSEWKSTLPLSWTGVASFLRFSSSASASVAYAAVGFSARSMSIRTSIW